MKILFTLLFTYALCHSNLLVDNMPLCPTTYDGIDLKTKLYTKILAPAHLFYYTPAEIKNDLQQENPLTWHHQEWRNQVCKLQSDIEELLLAILCSSLTENVASQDRFFTLLRS